MLEKFYLIDPAIAVRFFIQSDSLSQNLILNPPRSSYRGVDIQGDLIVVVALNGC